MIRDFNVRIKLREDTPMYREQESLRESLNHALTDIAINSAEHSRGAIRWLSDHFTILKIQDDQP